MAGDSQCITLTVRLIRSFEHRNVKHIVIKNADLTQTAAEFIQYVIQDIQSKSGVPPPLRKYLYDTLKIQHKAHGAKTSDPVMNTEDDDKLMLKPDQTLTSAGVENETELSLFKLDDYEAYKKNPMAGF